MMLRNAPAFQLGAPVEYTDFDAGTMLRAGATLSPAQRETLKTYLQQNVPSDVLEYFSPDPLRKDKILAVLRKAFDESILRSERGPGGVKLPSIISQEFLAEVYDDAVGLGPLEALLRDETVNSINVVSWDNISFERGGETYWHGDTFRDQRHLEQIADNLALLCNKALSKTRPRMMYFTRDPRTRIVVDIASVNGPYIGFRRGRRDPWPLTRFAEIGSMSLEMCRFLAECARAQVPFMIVGDPGSGKTTVAEAMLAELPDVHLVIIEDGVDELAPRHPNYSHLVVASQDDAASEAGNDMASATRAALRMNTNQVFYGETLGGTAGWIIANAASYRCVGTTLHGIGIQQALARFAMMAQMGDTRPPSPLAGMPDGVIRGLVALSFKLVILCGRLADNRRVIREIAWLEGVEHEGDYGIFKLTPIYTIQEQATAASGIQVQWARNPNFGQLPEPYHTSLDVANLRVAQRMASGVTKADAFQAAIQARNASHWEEAATSLMQAVHAARSAGRVSVWSLPEDVIQLFQQILTYGKVWPELQQRAPQVWDALEALYRARDWERLDRAMALLDNDVPLAMAVGLMRLRLLRIRSAQSRDIDQQISSILEHASYIADQQPVEALKLVLSVPDGYDRAHYRRLLPRARELFASVQARVAYAERTVLVTQLATLSRLAGEPMTGELSAERPTFAVIREQAAQTASALAALGAGLALAQAAPAAKEISA